MNLQHLLHYVVKHPDTQVSISLKQLATEVLENTDKKAELLCDFSLVAKWVLSSHDREQIRSGKLSPYCTLYGGDLKAYGECILMFVEFLEQAGIRPIFFVGGPPGSEKIEEFEAKFNQYREDSLKMQERCASIEQVCAGNRFLQVAWSFSEAMSVQVQCVLRAAGARMISCCGDPLAEMVQYSRIHSGQVVGVVSRSMEFVLNVPGLKVILPDVVGSIVSVKALTDENCPAVSSESLARALGLRENKLADLAALICGCSGSLLAELGLDDNSGVESVAKWLQDQEKPILELYPKYKELMGHIQTRFLISTSEKKCVPESQLDSHESKSADTLLGNSESSDKLETILPKSLAEVVKVKVQSGVMLPHLLSMVEGRFWRNSAVELASLGQPCINDVTLALRTSLYSLMGLEKVTEYGRTSARTFDMIPVQLKMHVACGLNQLKALEKHTKSERLSFLFDLVGNPQHYRDYTNLEECVSAAYKIGSEIDKPISGAAVVVCASLLLLFQANTVLNSFSSLSYFELDALLVTCLTCLADYPPCIHLCCPPVRAVSIAMHFSHILEQVYIMASYLGLLDELPAPASLFCSMAYIPYHIAGCSEASSSHFDASNLAVIQSHFFSLSNLEPVIAFQAEIVNGWKDPNLSLFLERFSSSLEAVAAYKTQLTDKEGAALNSITGGELNLSSEWTRDLDLSSSVDSNASSIIKCSELSSAQDYIVTEEELFFTALFDDVNGDTDGVDDVIDSSDIPGDDSFDDDNIFSIFDSEQQLINSNKALIATTGSAPEPTETSKNDDITNPKLATAVVDTIPPDSATLDENVTHSQPSTSSVVVSDSQSNPATPLHSNPRSRPPGSAPSQPIEDQKELPVMAHREKILQLVHSHRVVCIEGETGCGKSTKIPQFILEDSLKSNPATPCKILVTQPRRVAAIKLAERVAAERKERLGQTVGYCIGGERHRTSETNLTYCTVGYLLQALVHNPSMILHYTHIILDEIHERSTDTDFALIIVRKLVAASESLKVVIMSATMEGHTIANYFEQAISFTEVADPYFVGAKRFTVDQYFIDELDQLVDVKKPAWSEWQAAASSNLKQLILQQPPENLQEALTRIPTVTLFAQNVCTELIISQANLGEQILVFLPGISEIATYYDMLNMVLEVRKIKDHFLVFVMHSQVPFEDQKEVFKPPLPNKAHVILATNIAESSITLPKLRMVINFGIYRQLEYDSKRHMSQLIKKWCSQASCAQRTGRAGRVFEGVAVHLFTKRFYWVIIPEFDSPEILHAPLAKLVLQAKQIGSKMGIPLPSEFLSQAVDPPSLEQMELALNELASFGAIVSRPGLPVSEEAEITLLGRFALTLPLDIEFSRLVLYGIFFGIPTDAIVIAAAASLSQDVFNMPTRMIIKEDSIFSESLKRSMRTRCYFDGGQYSDPIMVCNLFREWIEYRNRCAMEEGLLSKHTFLHSFCSNYAVRWNRLLLLEHSVAEIASRVLPHVPQEYYLYNDVCALSDITSYRRGFNFTSDLEDSGGRRQRKLRLSSILLHFCDNANTIKALLAASFAHNFIIGHRGVESPYSKERKDSCHTLTVMSNLSYDPSETVTLKSDNIATIQDVQHLVSAVLPHRYCEVQLVDCTWYIHLHPEFSSNPKTALMRAQMGDQSEGETSSGVGGFLSDTSVVQQKLSLDMCYFWQYGERKPSWKVADAAFTKPRHPLMVNWTRVRKEKEIVFVSEWRNPSGLICDLGLQCPPFLGVVSTMQGIQHRSAVSARGVTVLPSLANGKEALLMLLAFQSQATKVSFLVSDDLIAGVMIDSFLLPLPMAQVGRISVNDIVRINKLRQAMSKVMKTDIDGSSCLFPMEEMSTIHALLRCVLEGTPNLTKPLDRPTKTGMISLLQDEDSTDSEFDFDPDDVEEEVHVTLDCFKFYPPLQCTLLDAVTCQSVPLESLEKDHLFQKKMNNGREVREGMLASSESPQTEQLPTCIEQPEDPLGDSKQQHQEELKHSSQSDQLLESTPSQQQLSMLDQLPRPDQLHVFQEQLHHQEQLLEQQGGSFQLSPLAEPFVPNDSSFDSMVTSPLVSMAPCYQGTQGRLPLYDVHNQASPVQIQNVQHSPCHGIIQNLPVSKVQGSPVHSVQSMSFSGENFTGRQQLQSNISNVIHQRPPQVEPRPDYCGSQRIPPPVPSPPPPPPLPFNPYDLHPNYHANFLSIIFHLLDKASCKPAGEGELEVQKAKLLCQRLMLISAQQLQLQSQLQPSLPRPFIEQDQSQHGGGLAPEYRPYLVPPRGRRESSGPPDAAIQTLPAATCLASKAPRNATSKSKDEKASNGVHPKRVNELCSRTAEVKREHGDSVMEALVRPLRSPTTGLMEEHPEDQKNTGDVAGGHRNGGHAREVTSTEEVGLVLESACETPPVQDGAPSTSVKMSSASSQDSNIKKHSARSLAENMADKTLPPSSPISSQNIITEASPITPAGNHEASPAVLIQEAQGDAQGSISKTSSVSQLQEDVTNKISPTSSPQRDSLSPIATAAASSLIQTQQPKSQRHLSDPPASRSRGIPKIGTSQLTQALLSPPHHYPLPQAFCPPLSLSQLAALQPSFNRPFSASLSPPKRPSFPGGFLHRSAPSIPTHVFDSAHQIRPSFSFPSLSNSYATRSLDFSCRIQPPASVPPQGACSPPNGALLAMTAAISSSGLPQRPHLPPPPPPPPPGFTAPPPISPHCEGQRSPPTGAQVSHAVETSIPPQLPMQPQLPASTVGPQAAAPPLYRLIKVKDLNPSASGDGSLASPETFAAQALPPPPSGGHEHSIPGVTSSMPLSNRSRSRGRVPQGGRRMPAKKTSHHMQHDKPPPFRYQSPPPLPSQAHGSSNTKCSLLPPPPGLGWPLPPPPPPPPSIYQYGRHEPKAPPRPSSPHPDLIMNYTARHKFSPLISALMPDPMHLHVQNYQASGLHVQSLEYNRCANNNKRERRSPSYEQFGIPGEQLMQYFCTMLATKGRDLELNLLCGPYYRDLLKCYRVCARENELLSPSFFEQYSCFTVYGEPGHFMVRLNSVTKEGHMTEQNHMTRKGPTQSDTSDAPPNITKDSEEPTIKNSGDGNLETAVPPSTVEEEQSVVVPHQEQNFVIATAVTTEIAEVPSSLRGDVLEESNADPEVHSTIEYQVSEELTQNETEEKGDKFKSEIMDDVQLASKSVIEEVATAPLAVSAGEDWDEENEEMNIQPLTSSTDTVSAPIATTTGSAKENWDEESEEINTEPVNSKIETSEPDHSFLPISETDQSAVPIAGASEYHVMSEATSLDEANVKEGIPQPNSSRNEEVEIKEKESEVPDISAFMISEVIHLPTEPSTAKDGDVTVDPVSGEENIDDKQPEISDMLSVSVPAELNLPTHSSTAEDWETTSITEPITSREEIEDEQPPISAIPVLLAAELTLPTESSTMEDWGATVEPITGGDMEQEGTEKQSLLFGASSSDMAHVDELPSKEDQAVPASPVIVEEKVEEKQSCDLRVSAAEVMQLIEASPKEDWGAIPEQLPVPLATAADEQTSIKQTPASFTGYDEDCWIESEQLPSYIQSAPEQPWVAPSNQLESEEPKKVTVYDEDCWQENVVPEFVSIRRVECKPLRILKREEPPKGDEQIGTQWHERKPAAAHSKGGATADRGGDRPEKSGGGGKKRKNKRKKKGKWGQEEDDRRERFSPAPRAEAKSTLGRAGKQSSSSKDKEQSSSSINKEQSSASLRDRERPSSSRDRYRGQSSSSRDSCRGREHRQYLSEVKQRFKAEKEARDRSSDSSQVSKEDSSKGGVFDGEGSYSGRRRETREFYRGKRNWCVGPTGRWYEYGSGWRQDKRRQEQKDQSEKK